jgi:hypothetical protein
MQAGTVNLRGYNVAQIVRLSVGNEVLRSCHVVAESTTTPSPTRISAGVRRFGA